MSIKYSDWIGESISSNGAGDITLGGTIQGFAPMSSAGVGEVYYTIVDGHNKETGLGSYGGGNSFTRTTIIATLINGVYTPNGAPLNLSDSAQIYGTINSGSMKDIYNRLAAGDADTDEIYVYIDEQISDVNQAITDLDNQINTKIDNLGPDDVGAYPRTGGDLTGPAVFKNSSTGIHIDGGDIATGTAGDFRFNPTLGVFEGYFDGKWRNIGGGTGVVWAPTAVSINPAEVGKGYLINADGLTITLPAAPEAGNSIGIGDYNGQNFTATVARNGKPIMGMAENFTFNVKNANIVLSFVDNTIGWVLTQGFGESSVPMAIANKSAPAVTIGQTVFSFPNYGTDSVDVYYNGKKLLRGSDYTANNTANTVTLSEPVSFADDVVELYNWNQAAVVQANKIVYDNTTTDIPATTMQAAVDYAIQQPSGMKNRIINGKFDISQRGTSFPAAVNAAHNLDRFSWWQSSTAVVTIAQQADAPKSFNKSLRVTVTTADAAIGASEYGIVQHRIEGYNVSDLVGTSFTLSFWMRSSKVGVHCVNIRNGAQDRTYVVEFTVAAVNTWEFKSVTVVGGLPASGVWDFTNGTGLVINWVLLAGTDGLTSTTNTWLNAAYSCTAAQVNVLDTVGNTFAITGVQLEAGEVATPFEHRLYGQELSLCQRYYSKSYAVGTVPGTATPIGSITYQSGTSSAANVAFSIRFPQEMRAAPTVNTYDMAGTIGKVTRGVNGASGTIGDLGSSGCTIIFNAGASAVLFQMHYVASAEL